MTSFDLWAYNPRLDEDQRGEASTEWKDDLIAERAARLRFDTDDEGDDDD